MEQKNGKNYYKILEVKENSVERELREAYQRAKSLYAEDSVAVYSLYTEEERKQKLQELNEAYETLSDPVKRKIYDDRVKAAPASTVQKNFDMTSFKVGKDIFEEYNEVGAFRDGIKLKAPLLVMNPQDQMIAERYRILYTRIEEICLKRGYKTFAVTSAVKGEGKTLTSLNLAYVMATEFKKKVLVMEGDLRNPSISSTHLELNRTYGLVDVLRGDADLKSAVSRLDDTSLYFLPARCSVKNSSALLDSPALRSAMNSVKCDFDYVIVDSPPILPLVDISILAKAVDALMLVVRAGKTPKDMVTKAVSSLPKERVMGIVLNGASDEHMKKYYY